MRQTLLFAAALFATMSLPSMAQQFESGPNKVQLIELYTSEGCSSCPPADRWLSSLKSSDKLWSHVVPVAFHVDYWDYIGWIDPFANHEFSQRQRRYAAEQNETTVYTPGVRSNGQEWRGWRNSDHAEITQTEIVGNLKFSVSPGGEFTANFDNQLNENVPLLNVAILGVDLSSKVTRGENSGRELKHDFVALNLSRYSSHPGNSDNSTNQWSGKLPSASKKSTRYALAVWVSRGSDLTPVQSTGGYLPATFQDIEG